MKKVRRRRLVCIKPCRFRRGKFEVHFEFGVKYTIVLKSDGYWWLVNSAQKKSLHLRLIPPRKSESFSSSGIQINGDLDMRGGRWVKCVKTIAGIFIERKFYRISYRSGTFITVIDEFGNGIEFVDEDSIFKDHFKFAVSQKRGITWAIQRQL